MADRSPTAPETASVQAFILERQADVLARAITTVTACPEQELAQELHRLSGTLGSYQLLDARAAVQEFEAALHGPDVGPAAIERARAAALDRLGPTATTPRDDEDEGTP